MDPTGLKMAFDCGSECGGRRNLTSIPGAAASQKLGDRWVKEGKKEMKANRFDPWTGPARETGAYLGGYIKYDLGRFLQSEQGQLVAAWMGGSLPQYIHLDESFRTTQGLRDGPATRKYTDIILADLIAGRRITSSYYYNAGPGIPSNPNIQKDAVTMFAWEDASNAERSLAITGSHLLHAEVIERPSESSAIIQFSASNPMTLGSLASPIRQYADSLPGTTGPLSAVSINYSWTSTVRW
ncbi:hypothetical protein [Microbacterium sp. PMB16]|uniref:hypothetical protein n=1 Tax=Microbacterium sp. PMB16 TaxID=3120157 RepID=UPI003F4B6F14